MTTTINTYMVFFFGENWRYNIECLNDATVNGRDAQDNPESGTHHLWELVEHEDHVVEITEEIVPAIPGIRHEFTVNNKDFAFLEDRSILELQDAA